LAILVAGSVQQAGATVELIGMLDSPYVRRVAISLQLLGLRFEHRSISVFRTFEQFRQINPVVKAPSLVCADGFDVDH
jgi:glutathione S-transferase